MPFPAKTTVNSSPSPSVELKSFPQDALQLPPHTQILAPKTIPGSPITRDAVLRACLKNLKQALAETPIQNPALTTRLLFILPDKTRTQISPHILIDAGLTLKHQHPNLEITLLYGLGTHPFMTTPDLKRLIGADRYLELQRAGLQIHQQSTKAVTSPLARVIVWKFDQTVPEVVKTPFDLTRITILLQKYWSAIPVNTTLRLFVYIAPTLLDTHLPLIAHFIADLDRHIGARPWKLIIDRTCVTPNQFEQLHQALLPGSRCTFRREATTTQIVDLSLGLMPQADACFGIRWGHHYTIQVPQLLFNNHLTIIAGDTKIHPYEGCYGSGGINKMLAVGIASLDEIRRSHSTHVLLHPHTRVGDTASPFVAQLGQTAESIRDAMLTRRGSLAVTAPYGFSVIAQGEEQIWATAFGQNEAARHQIATTWKQAFTVTVTTPVDVVFHDVAAHKGTDILAGARTLQYLCDWHSQKRPLLSSPETECVALMFNRCSELKNNGGIGNEGTKIHMDVLGKIVAAECATVAAQLGQSTTLAIAKAHLIAARDRVLHRWERHLNLSSEPDNFLLELYDLTCQGEQLQQRGIDDPVILPLVLEKLERDRQGFTPLAKTLEQIYQTLRQHRRFSWIKQTLQQALNLYSQHEGLGEGGQRTLRLLKICRYFGTWLIASDNQAVAEYLKSLDPDLSQHLPPAIRPAWETKPLPMGILGIVPVNLAHHRPQQAVAIAMAYGRWHKPNTQLKSAFLSAPLILQRSGL